MLLINLITLIENHVAINTKLLFSTVNDNTLENKLWREKEKRTTLLRKTDKNLNIDIQLTLIQKCMLVFRLHSD